MSINPYTKANQLKKNREPKFNFTKYANWIHSNNKPCAVCGRLDIEVHHITDIHRIAGTRRDDKRVIPLCKSHHKEGKEGIHIMSKEMFYREVMELELLLKCSSDLLKEYEDSLL